MAILQENTEENTREADDFRQQDGQVDFDRLLEVVSEFRRRIEVLEEEKSQLQQDIEKMEIKEGEDVKLVMSEKLENFDNRMNVQGGGRLEVGGIKLIPAIEVDTGDDELTPTSIIEGGIIQTSGSGASVKLQDHDNSLRLYGSNGNIRLSLVEDKIDFRDSDGNITGEVRGSAGQLILSSEDTMLLTSDGQTTITPDGIFSVSAGGDCTLFSSEDVTLQATNNIILISLPTSDPGVTGALWNDAGTVKIS